MKSSTVNIREKIRSGGIWTVSIATSGLVLCFARNWFLGRMDTDGSVLGVYALVLIFISFITTFVLYGGAPVLSYYLPKIKDSEKQGSFVMGYFYIILAMMIIWIYFLFRYPHFFELLFHRKLDTPLTYLLLLITPVVTLNYAANYILTGLLAYRASAIVQRIQLIFIAPLAMVFFFVAPQLLRRHPLAILGSGVFFSNMLGIIIGIVISRKELTLRLRPWLPRGFWSYSFYIHMNTILTFAYETVDQLFIAGACDVSRLGVYFQLLTLAQLVRFLPQEIGRLMVSSFSYLMANDREDVVQLLYHKMCKISILVTAIPVLIFIFLSREVTAIFGPAFANHHRDLIWLSAILNIGALGNINSMLILAKQETKYFFFNSITLIGIQIVLSFLLIRNLGVFGIILAKGAGILSAQIGLFSIIYFRLPGRRKPDREYWISQILVTIALLFICQVSDLALMSRLAVLSVMIISLVVGVGLYPQEILQMLRQRTLESRPIG
ncbi:MAG: oligosaccharide flippase family protein [bacterium]